MIRELVSTGRKLLDELNNQNHISKWPSECFDVCVFKSGDRDCIGDRCKHFIILVPYMNQKMCMFRIALEKAEEEERIKIAQMKDKGGGQ